MGRIWPACHGLYIADLKNARNHWPHQHFILIESVTRYNQSNISAIIKSFERASREQESDDPFRVIALFRDSAIHSNDCPVIKSGLYLPPSDFEMCSTINAAFLSSGGSTETCTVRFNNDNDGYLITVIIPTRIISPCSVSNLQVYLIPSFMNLQLLQPPRSP